VLTVAEQRGTSPDRDRSRPALSHDPALPRDKAHWRAQLLAARRAVPEQVHTVEADALAAGVVAVARRTTDPICCYVPMVDEPGSLAMLDALRDAGHEVLLPVVPGAPSSPTTSSLQSSGAMNWAPYRGPSSLVEGPYRLRQPAGPGWGPAAVATAGLVLVPALAVDERGVRLGRGAGWYDRTLTLARPGIPLLAVVRDEEVVAALPVERHDVLMTGVLTPHGGARALGRRLD
jgi:5-formyltetrahydrofolate cyclo-ligase